MPQPLHVLIVEDTLPGAELVLRELRRAGFEPVWHRVDTEAAYLEQLHPNLEIILSDYVMPQFGGLRALELLKERGMDIPLIIVSGTIGEETAVEAMRLGAADYLLKDRLARLGPAVHQALDQSRLRKERKLARETLELREKALDEVSQGVLICDENRLVTYANASFTKITGYSEGEILGRNCSILQGPDTDPETILKIRAALHAGEPFEGEILNYRKDGQTFWNDLALTPILGDQSRPLGFIGIQRDVSERKRGEEALRLFRTLVDRSNDSFEVVDPETARFLDVNEKGATDLGYSREEYLSLRVWDIDPLLDAARWPSLMEQMRSIRSSSGEGHHRRKDGTIFPIEFNAIWVHLDRDYIVSVVRDITERKQAEEALRWETAFFEAQVDSSLDGVLVVDSHGKKVLQNPRMNELWKIPPHIADSRDDAEQFQFVADRTKDPRQFADKVVHLYSHPDEISHDEIEVIDGTILERHSSPVVGKDGKYYGRIWTFRDITERKRAEETLRESEARFSGAFEHAPIGVALVSPEGRWLKVNRALCALVGYSEAEMLTRTFQDITHPEDLERDLENLHRLVAGEIRTYQMEKRYIHAQGHFITILLNVSLVRDGQGQPLYFISQIQDITERRRAQTELETEKARLVAAQAVAKVGSWETDLATFAVSWSEETYRIFETSPDKFQPSHQGFLELVHPDDREAVGEAFVRSMGQPGTHAIEHRLLTLDGRIKFVEERWQSVSDDQGRPLHSTGTCHDITERKEAEQALSLALEHLQLAVKAGKAGTWELDILTGKVEWDDQMLALYGKTAGNLEPGAERWGKLIHPDDEAHVQAAYDAALQDGKDSFEMEFRIHRSDDGSLRFIRAMGLLLRDESGHPLRMIGINWDVTEERNREERLSEALSREKELSEKARAGERAKSEFLAVMSHEIRTPMNGILGFSEMLAASPDLPADSRDSAKTIASSGEALLRILDDILDFSRLEAGGLKIEKSLFSAREVVQNIETLLAIHAGEKRLEFHMSIDEGLPEYLWNDAGRLRQVLLNIVGNAIKFTARGSITLGMRPSREPLKTAEPGVDFFVRDTGPGIPEDELGHIFESFTQADSSISRRYGGTGLGLSISQNLVDLMGGKLTVRSKVGEGSEFCVTLPIGVPEGARQTVKPDSDGEVLDETFALRHPLKILLAEDDRVNGKLMRMMLRKLGYEPLTAQDGAAAVEVYLGEHPDCILMDLQMPRKDGLQATLEIREIENSSPGSARAFIAALTANIVAEDRQRCFEAGMDSYMNKPVKRDQLAKTLEQASAMRADRHG